MPCSASCAPGTTCFANGCLYGGTHDFLTGHAADLGWSRSFVDARRDPGSRAHRADHDERLVSSPFCSWRIIPLTRSHSSRQASVQSVGRGEETVWAVGAKRDPQLPHLAAGVP